MEGERQTNIMLTEEERLLLKHASGEPYSHGAIVNGVRALLADWVRRGQPEVATAQAAECSANV